MRKLHAINRSPISFVRSRHPVALAIVIWPNAMMMINECTENRKKAPTTEEKPERKKKRKARRKMNHRTHGRSQSSNNSGTIFRWRAENEICTVNGSCIITSYRHIYRVYACMRVCYNIVKGVNTFSSLGDIQPFYSRWQKEKLP